METFSVNAVFSQSLLGVSGLAWRLGQIVTQLHPGKVLLDGVQDPFELAECAAEEMCEATLAPEVHAQMKTEWTRAHGLHASPVNAVYNVRWKGHELRVIRTEWKESFNEGKQHLVVASNLEVARAFVQEMSAFCNQPRKSVLLFKNGCWSKSHDLWMQIQAATFEDIVLAGDLKERIRKDFRDFLAAQSQYERYGVVHKRGVLLVGPPGNGKTHFLRALIRELAIPCLHVMSFKERYGTDEENIDRVFERARDVAPCVLVFEDLDAMITDRNRSYFLNQLDGLAALPGVITLATTNHPDRLDPAIIERPSRFDRKYHFDPPGPQERHDYLAAWNARLDRAMHIEESSLQQLVALTDGFSFAYLKELYVSGMVRWMVHQRAGAMPDELTQQLHALRAQMRSAHARKTVRREAQEDGPQDDNQG